MNTPNEPNVGFSVLTEKLIEYVYGLQTKAYQNDLGCDAYDLVINDLHALALKVERIEILMDQFVDETGEREEAEQELRKRVNILFSLNIVRHEKTRAKINSIAGLEED